jgi:AraC-like DNA-binding protein
MTWLDMISPQVNIVWHGRNDPGWIEPLRRLYDHELVVVTEGCCQITVQDVTLDCGPGSFVIIPADQLHVTVAGPERTLYRYCVHFDWIYQPSGLTHGYCVFHPGHIQPERVHSAPGFMPRKLLRGLLCEPKEIQSLLKRMASAWAHRTAADRLFCRALLLEILIRLLAPSAEEQDDSVDRLRIAREARQLLDETIAQNESIQDRLETLGYSYAHVCRLFQKAYGTRPMQYVNAARVQRAKALLQENRTIAEVAHLAGFNDAAYFARVFKAHASLSPRAFRAFSLRSANQPVQHGFRAGIEPHGNATRAGSG